MQKIDPADPADPPAVDAEPDTAAGARLARWARRSTPRWMPRTATFLCAAAIGLAALAAFSNSFAGAFVFDDCNWIGDNPSVRQLWPVSSWLTPEDMETYGGRPVVTLSLALNHIPGGMDPRGYHVVNLAIHILAAWTLFGLIRRTLRLPPPNAAPLVAAEDESSENGMNEPRFAAAATPLALAATLLWTVHPLQTNAVTYIVQRTESLVALFYLLTLYCVLRGAVAATAGRRWYAAAALSCFLGMATKEVMVTAPLAVLLYDRTFLGGSFRKALARRWGLYLALAACWGVVVWQLLATNFHGGTTGFGAGRFTPWSYLLTEAEVLAHYLRLVFWPVGQCLDYGWPPAASLGQILLPGLLIVGLLGLTVWALVKRPAMGFLGAAFFLVLAPTSSFIPIADAAFEHRMYLPLAAGAVLVVLAGYALSDRLLPRTADGNDFTLARWKAPLAVLVAALVGLSSATFARNADYYSELVMWRDAVKNYPNNSRSHYSLGCALAAEGFTADAVAEYEKALALEPVYSPADIHNMLGLSLQEEKKNDAAAREYEKALEISPKFTNARANLAAVLKEQGKTAEAGRERKKAGATDAKP